MQRAAVLIGVSRAGPLPQLQAVEAGLSGMRRWAHGQGITDESLVVLSDSRDGEVDARAVYDAVHEIVERSTVEQLVVYFAGHGVNQGHSEFWLLSGAPTNPNEAVNVAGSVVLAQRCGIPHVVFISDACRTAPGGVHNLSVTGSEIFPNRPPAGRSGSVDVFYACSLGDPAYEFTDPDEASGAYRSIYTDVLLECLDNHHRSVVDRVSERGGDSYDIVRPWPLKRGIPDLVRDRIVQEDLWRRLSQTPDAVVSSDPDLAWISRVAVPTDSGLPVGPRRRRTPADLRSAASATFNQAIDGAVDARALDTLAAADGGRRFLDDVDRLLAEFGPQHYETGGGFKVQGEEIVEGFCQTAPYEHLDGSHFRVTLDGSTPAATVLLRLSGSCVLVPTIAQFMTSLTFDDRLLVDVSFEPMDTSPRWGEYRARAVDLRRARAIIGTSTRHGVLDLNGDSAEASARYLQELKSLDPAFSIYAAYAYHDLGRTDLIDEMARFQFGDLDVTFFDLALLGRAVEPPSNGSAVPPPGIPMLSRGWPLLNALRVVVPPVTADPANRLASLWTSFRAELFSELKAMLQLEAASR